MAGANQAISHCLNQWWHSLLTHICAIRPQWFKLCSFEWDQSRSKYGISGQKYSSLGLVITGLSRVAIWNIAIFHDLCLSINRYKCPLSWLDTPRVFHHPNYITSHLHVEGNTIPIKEKQVTGLQKRGTFFWIISSQYVHRYNSRLHYSLRGPISCQCCCLTWLFSTPIYAPHHSDVTWAPTRLKSSKKWLITHRIILSGGLAKQTCKYLPFPK